MGATRRELRRPAVATRALSRAQSHRAEGATPQRSNCSAPRLPTPTRHGDYDVMLAKCISNPIPPGCPRDTGITMPRRDTAEPSLVKGFNGVEGKLKKYPSDSVALVRYGFAAPAGRRRDTGIASDAGRVVVCFGTIILGVIDFAW
jgi:hypothetical protein